MATILGIWIFLFISSFIILDLDQQNPLLIFHLCFLHFLFQWIPSLVNLSKHHICWFFALDLYFFSGQTYVVDCPSMQSNLVTGCSGKHKVFVALCTQPGHDDKDKTMFLRIFAYKFSRFEFSYSFIDFTIFEKPFYQSISSISTTFL